jgi:hypothetical protein
MRRHRSGGRKGTCARAAEKFGPTNNSPHESYAVIKEEFEEAQTDARMFEHNLDFSGKKSKRMIQNDKRNGSRKWKRRH